MRKIKNDAQKLHKICLKSNFYTNFRPEYGPNFAQIVREIPCQDENSTTLNLSKR